jgi:DNA-binding response OmpR family regulator
VARILIVEPHADIRSLLELVVRRLGHEPVVHAGGAEPPDVDAAVIEPGEGHGLSLARALREAGVPLLFTSIFPADRDMLELQPSAYLVKPFPLYALEAALAVALARVELAATA